MSDDLLDKLPQTRSGVEAICSDDRSRLLVWNFVKSYIDEVDALVYDLGRRCIDNAETEKSKEMHRFLQSDRALVFRQAKLLMALYFDEIGK